jgi:hypothetical protein
LREFINGPVRRVNPIFETGKGFQTLFAPSGLSRVPFTWRIERIERPVERYDMEAVGGLVGVGQDAGTNALRPKAGWAVREMEGLDVLVNRLEREHVVRPGTGKLFRRVEREFEGEVREVRRPLDLPEDVARFYFRTDGAELFGRGEGARFRIVRSAEFETVAGPEDWRALGIRERDFDGRPPQWAKFCRLPNDGFVAIDVVARQGLLPDVRAAVEAMEAESRSRVEAEERRIAEDIEKWAAGRWVKPTQKQRTHRLGIKRMESLILSEVTAKVEALRRTGCYHMWPVVAFAASGEWRLVADSFAQFLQRALDGGGDYWWMDGAARRA